LDSNNRSISFIWFLSNSTFDNGKDGYKLPIAFKLIPPGDRSDESLRKTFHFLYEILLSNVRNDLFKIENLSFTSSKSENNETSAVVKCAIKKHSDLKTGFRFSFHA